MLVNNHLALCVSGLGTRTMNGGRITRCNIFVRVVTACSPLTAPSTFRYLHDSVGMPFPSFPLLRRCHVGFLRVCWWVSNGNFYTAKLNQLL